MRLRTVLVAAAAAAATAISMAGPAQAAPAPVIEKLAGPLSFSVDHGKIVVAQSFAGKLTQYNADGTGKDQLFVRNPKIASERSKQRAPARCSL